MKKIFCLVLVWSFAANAVDRPACPPADSADAPEISIEGLVRDAYLVFLERGAQPWEIAFHSDLYAKSGFTPQQVLEGIMRSDEARAHGEPTFGGPRHLRRNLARNGQFPSCDLRATRACPDCLVELTLQGKPVKIDWQRSVEYSLDFAFTDAAYARLCFFDRRTEAQYEKLVVESLDGITGCSDWRENWKARWRVKARKVISLIEN